MTNKAESALLDQVKHTSRYIADKISEQGPISFSEFMQDALYAPQLGYYRNGLIKFGEEGDFITAPQISPLFGCCVAKQCQQVLQNLGHGSILEIGAGNGILAKSILTELAKQKTLPEHYFILELSADLQQRQRELLADSPELLARVQWLTELPTTFSGVIIANEVVDAMPVHKFKIDHNQSLQEYFVDWEQDHFLWQLQPPTKALKNIYKTIQTPPLSAGYVSEINSLIPGWLDNLASSLREGLILLIDYGFPEHEYYHMDRSTGTLMCHFHHQAHADPLLNVGVQDITAHVNFTQVANCAQASNLTLAGYTHQAGFLINCGITELMLKAGGLSYFHQAQQVKQLTLPSEMGELFKAIALTRKLDCELLGFRDFDLRAQLFGA